MSLVGGVSLSSLSPSSVLSLSVLSTGDSSYSRYLEDRIEESTSTTKALQSSFERLSTSLSRKLDYVIFTLPIYFTDSEKELFHSAAKNAGWLVPRKLEDILDHVQTYHRSSVQENYPVQYELVIDIGPSAAGSRLVTTEVEENIRMSDVVADQVVHQQSNDIEGLIRNLVDPPLSILQSDPSSSPPALRRIVIISSLPEIIPNLAEKLRTNFSANPTTDVVVAPERPSQHAAKLALALRNIVLSDKLCVFNTAPLRIGIAKSDGFVLTLIPRHFTLPNHRSAILTTSKDGQKKVTIRIVAGVSSRVDENYTVAELVLDGFSARSKGAPIIQVTLEVDETGETKILAEEIDEDGESVQCRTVELKALTGEMTEDEMEAYWKQGDAVDDEEMTKANAAWSGKAVQGTLLE